MSGRDAAVRVHGPWDEVCGVLGYTGMVEVLDTSANLVRFRMDSGATGFAVHDADTGSVLLPVADFSDGAAAADLFRALVTLLDFEVELLLVADEPVVLARRPAREATATTRPVLRLVPRDAGGSTSIPA